MREIHRHSWVWAVLPPECGKVLVVGDPELATLLRHCGVEVILADDECPCDVLLVAGSVEGACNDNGDLIRPEARLVAVDVRPDPRLGASGRLGLVTQLALAPVSERRCRHAADRTATRLRELGYSPRFLSTGNSVAPWSLGGGSAGWRDVTDRPSGMIVVADRMEHADVAAHRDRDAMESSVVSLALDRASIALGRPLRRRHARTLESGKILLNVESDGEEYVLRLGAGPSGRLIESSLRQVEALAAASPPKRIRDLVVWPLAHGPVGPAHYVIERRAPGREPRRITDAQLDECLEFVQLLHTTGQDGRTGSDPQFIGRVTSWHGRMASFLDDADISRLSSIADHILDSVRDTRLGFGHGDMWPANLLVENGVLQAVVDWDWATGDSLPLVDAMEIWAMTIGSTAAVEPGPRSIDLILPFASGGFDERLREHARIVGWKPARSQAVALTAAYWLERTYRDLRPFSPRPRNRRWFEENVLRPVRVLSQEVAAS